MATCSSPEPAKNDNIEVVPCHFKLLGRLVQAHIQGNDGLVARTFNHCSDCLSLHHNVRARPNGARNAWFFAKEIRKRIDDAPVLGSNIRTKYLKALSAQAKPNVPRSSYIKKIMEFQNSHYNRGKLYWEYLKQSGEASRGLCSFEEENTWTGIKTTRTLLTRLIQTPLYSKDENTRSPDDWQSRV
ncbi:hypothetical protein ACROYT_G008098 [Oculina patagonica]